MEAAGNDGDQSVEQSDDEQKVYKYDHKVTPILIYIFLFLQGGESSEDTEDSSQDDNNSSDDPSSEGTFIEIDLLRPL